MRIAKMILPGTSGEPFDVVIKNLGNENCYGFNGWSYEFTTTEENKLYEIPKGTVKVRIKAISGSTYIRRGRISIGE